MALSSIFKQLPRMPRPILEVIKNRPEDALATLYRNVNAVFGPKARVVTYRVLDEIVPRRTPTSVDIFFLVFEAYPEDDVTVSRKIRSRDMYKKATLRRIQPYEEGTGLLEERLGNEDVSGPLAFEAPEVIEAKIQDGKLIEMIGDVGTYILDLGDHPDEEFFFFYPHEPLVVTFV
jgi:hypothetical protein